MVRTPNSRALANVRSVKIRDDSLRPVLEINAKAGFESLLTVRRSDGTLVCVELDASQTAFLMALVSAWHVDKVHGVGEGWRGYRTYDEVGAIYAEITGRREPIEGETVRKYASRISTSLRSPTLCESAVREMARKLNIEPDMCTCPPA